MIDFLCILQNEIQSNSNKMDINFGQAADSNVITQRPLQLKSFYFIQVIAPKPQAHIDNILEPAYSIFST